jgi:hypothetical protein
MTGAIASFMHQQVAEMKDQIFFMKYWTVMCEVDIEATDVVGDAPPTPASVLVFMDSWF